MNWIDSLFNPANPAAQVASGAQVPTPQSGAPSPPLVPDDWVQKYVKAMGEAAGARAPRERGIINVLTGRDRQAAQDAAALDAPTAYYKMLGSLPQYQQQQNTATAGQLDTAQTMYLLQRLGVQLPGMTSPPTQGNNAAPAQNNPAAAPVSVAPLAPPQGTSPDEDRSALMMRLGKTNLGSIDPVQAQRSNIYDIGNIYAGLPKTAALGLDYLKYLQNGIPPGAGLIPGPGGTPQDFSGRPVTDVQGYLAQGEGLKATKTGEQQRITDRLRLGQEYNNKIGETAFENSFKPPVLMRAPDGSIVGVTPSQQAGAQASGALKGFRPLTEEETKAQAGLGEQYAKDQASLPDIRVSQNTINNMLDQADSFQPGTFGDIRANVNKLLTGIGVPPEKVAEVFGPPSDPAGADVIMKNTLKLAMSSLKASFGAQREAGFVIEKTMGMNPNIETQPEAYSFMLNTMKQESQRQAEYVQEQRAYKEAHGTIDGFAEQFDKAHPIESYSNRAMTDTYKVPPNYRFAYRSKKPLPLPNGQIVPAGRPIFLDPNGKEHVAAP